MSDKAIEAAARAIFAQRYRSGEYVFGVYLPGTEFSRSEARACVTAYNAAMEAEGPTEAQKEAYRRMLDEQGIGVAVQLEDIFALFAARPRAEGE